MLPAELIAEITTNLSAVPLESNIAAQVLAAVLAPLLRTAPNPDPIPKLPQKRARLQGRKAPRRKKPKRRVSAAREATDGPRERARAALKANPDASLTAVAKLAKCSRSTVVNARDELVADARRKPRETAKTAKPLNEPRRRAQQFLKEALGRGPRNVSDLEEAASRTHIDPESLQQARADLGIITSRANTGGAHAVQWSLPG